MRHFATNFTTIFHLGNWFLPSGFKKVSSWHLEKLVVWWLWRFKTHSWNGKSLDLSSPSSFTTKFYHFFRVLCKSRFLWVNIPLASLYKKSLVGAWMFLLPSDTLQRIFQLVHFRVQILLQFKIRGESNRVRSRFSNRHFYNLMKTMAFGRKTIAWHNYWIKNIKKYYKKVYTVL